MEEGSGTELELLEGAGPVQVLGVQPLKEVPGETEPGDLSVRTDESPDSVLGTTAGGGTKLAFWKTRLPLPLRGELRISGGMN